ncbi:MAG TPA: ThiF family adenylyltransferase [Bacteroidia bacterium]|nr:ThiF family adenylyltransferase [Bacteroidia bacterium]HRH08156.1 ThiF family adenylyltransferase [Bacteroidia bacterium]
MNNRFDLINSTIESIPNIKIISPLRNDYGNILGRVLLLHAGVELEFDVEIKPPYPLQFHETESIRFLNSELIEYDHVNRDGSICIHTYHCPEITQKLLLDFNSLKEWVDNYFLSTNQDNHYEHIIVNEDQYETLSTYLFTEVNHNFSKDSFGYFAFSHQASGSEGKGERHTFLVHSFLVGKTPYQCSWSKVYNEQRDFQQGVYVYIENPPVKHRRFAVEMWSELGQFISQEFFKFLYDLKRSFVFEKKGIKKFPLFIGYKIPTGETHWQCVIIDTNNFPNESVKLGNGYGGQFKEMPISWSSTKNCSYKYFFGRGKFSDKITEKKILIIGVGAIGSIVATTLTRGGCKFISLADYDVKEPENVCRSEYTFHTGITNKVDDLGLRLAKISPFIEVIPNHLMMDGIKYFINDTNSKESIKQHAEEFDIIIDCTTDDDVAYILDSLDLKSEIVSLSITNNANELLCSVNPNLYSWLMNRGSFIPERNEPLHQPTGCWNPTFKASYNDINSLVQFALKHINLIIDSGKQLRHFYLSTETENGYNIKMHQF